jgi:hypothetical protein
VIEALYVHCTLSPLHPHFSHSTGSSSTSTRRLRPHPLLIPLAPRCIQYALSQSRPLLTPQVPLPQARGVCVRPRRQVSAVRSSRRRSQAVAVVEAPRSVGVRGSSGPCVCVGTVHCRGGQSVSQSVWLQCQSVSQSVSLCGCNVSQSVSQSVRVVRCVACVASISQTSKGLQHIGLNKGFLDSFGCYGRGILLLLLIFIVILLPINVHR